ncbi:MAG: copper chaperone PCu(A)C [Rhodocyclaceae bacterium]|nr:copper chaperone PCu(A)C [Rhodocyclaceae bacterium]
MKKQVMALALGWATAFAAGAEVTVSEAWVRASLPQQRATGAFMKIRSADERLRLVGAATGVAEVAEIHEMRIENDIVRMGRVGAVELVPGETLELRPGGYHVMLMGLHEPLAVGREVALELLFEGADGVVRRVPVTALVQPLNARPGSHHR